MQEIHICENPRCGREHDGSYGSGRFCSLHCRKSFSSQQVKNRKSGYAIRSKKRKKPFGTWKCRFCGFIADTKHKLWDHYYKNHSTLLCGPHGKGKVGWNKGLTKLSDPRIAKQAKTLHSGYKSGRITGSMKGKHHSKATKLKLQTMMCNWLNTISPSRRVNYNKRSIQILEQIAKEHGWNIQHAENGGEFYTGIGYFVDAYDKEKNIVLEYDEPKHYVDYASNLLTQKDIERQTKIIEHLKCQFWRYNERTKTLWKVN